MTELTEQQLKSKQVIEDYANDYREQREVYKPIRCEFVEFVGLKAAREAVRYPFDNQKKNPTLDEDIALIGKLAKAGGSHAKVTRGLLVYFRLYAQMGWLVEYLTYRIGVENLSSTSTMHNELKTLTGLALAETKQQGCLTKQYLRMEMISYQALRHIWLDRKNHKHIGFTEGLIPFIESLPYADRLITI